jgi:hypothetical protein
MVDLPMPGLRRPGAEPVFAEPVVADPGAPWQVAVGHDDAGLPVHVRWDPVALAVSPVPGFELQLGVTVPLTVGGEDGLPSPAEERGCRGRGVAAREPRGRRACPAGAGGDDARSP